MTRDPTVGKYPILLASTLAATVFLSPAGVAADPAPTGVRPADSVATTSPENPVDMLARACPSRKIRAADLDFVAGIDGKLTLARAIRRAADERDEIEYGRPDELTGEYVFARTPNEIARVFRKSFGGDHFLARGIDAVAVFTDKTTQGPLDQVNNVTGRIIETGGRVLRVNKVPELKLKSRITNDNAGVSLQSRW